MINSALVLGLLLCTGCGDNKATAAPGALAVIVGAHSNMVAPSLLDTVQGEIDTASELGSPATVIVDDGSPTASAPLSLKTGNDNPLYHQDQVNQLTNLIDKTHAGNPEVDLLAAINLAARSVSDAVGPKTIVVIDSGLQTTGALRFQDQGGALLNANPDEVVDQLRRTQQLPNLTGMRVVFTGLGDTALPQQPLPAPARAVLVAFWTKIVESAGGKAEIKQAPLPNTRTLNGLPPVTIVPVAAQSIGPLPSITVLRDGTVGFVPNQAVFRYPDQARTVLADYAKAIKTGKRRCSPEPPHQTARQNTGSSCQKNTPTPCVTSWPASVLQPIESLLEDWAATFPDMCPTTTSRATLTPSRRHRTAR